MERRSFLAGLGTAGLAACSEAGSQSTDGAAPAVTRRKRELRMVTTWVKGFPGLGVAAQRLADRIGALTDGAITVKLYAAGELVSAFECFDAVSSGAADMYHGAEYYWFGKSPAFTFFTAIPFGMTTAEIMGWIRYGGGEALWRELSAQFNVIAFQAANSGHQLGGWFRRPIQSLDDLRGMTVRMPGVGGEVIDRLGASSKLLPGGEIYQALQTGAIDGTEWLGPWNDLAYGFYREAPYYHWPGFHEPGSVLSCGINLDLWNDLDPSEQAAIRYACQSVNDEAIAEYAMRNGEALEALVNEHGVTLVRFPDDVMKAAAEASQDVLADLAARDPFTARARESYETALRRLIGWSRIGDGAFMEARARFLAPS